MARPEPIHFECVKIGASQNKDGWILRLAIHPSDMNEAIALAPSGARFYCVLSEMPESLEDADRQEGERAVTLAGIVCKEHEFWRFLYERYSAALEAPVQNEKDAVNFLRGILGIKTRADLRDNQKARETFLDIYRRYHDHTASLEG